MAAAAYGAVVSLMHLLDNLQHPSRQHLQYDRQQIENLRENVSFLLEFLEDYSEILFHTETENLARQLAHAVDEAEKIIDLHVVDQLTQRSGYEFGVSSFPSDRDNVLKKIKSIKKEYEVDKGLSSFREDIDNVLNKIESIKKELLMVKDQKKPLQLSQRSASSSAPPSGGDKINIMVGFEEHLEHIMDQLTAHESDLQIVSIIGMGGIGKTTLAQNAFASRHVVDHFDLCKWITISQSYSIQDVVLGLLGELDNKNNSNSKQNLPELGEQLHKMLFGRRYLIVMDDVWSAEIWDELRCFFPNNKNRSRIVVTTRLSKVAVSLGSQNPYLMDFLGEEKSWNLFCIKVFGKEVCPNPELEKIGKRIVECCKGLPLAISVIGGLLRKSNTIREDWELVAKNVMKSLANSKDDEDCSNILSLSYRHLPIHLKPCFLYMRVFPEDEMIEVGTLINFWIAEGFVKPKGGKTLEEVASEYLKDLINRNLILIHEYSYSGDVRKCKVHDLLRDLCKREYEKEDVFCISKVGFDDLESKSTCFLCRSPAYKFLHESSITTLAATHVICFVCEACNARLVMIKDGFGVHYQHTRLRYLETRRNWESNSLPLLWNLQFLNSHAYSGAELSVGILLKMPQLRHLYVNYVIHVDPPVTEIGREDRVILEDLQTLRTEMNLRCSEEILARIPNVKTLNVETLTNYVSYRYGEQPIEVVPPVHPFHNLVDLHKLEALVCSRVNLKCISFPNSMKILNLMRCNCTWERMTIIGLLPNLEVLRLILTKGGPEWNPIEGEFLQLKTLSIVHNDLVRWNAEKYHFPKLERLYLEHMDYLEKIPPGIGEIETLREIRLIYFTESLNQSAKEIIEEQREYGNEELQLVLEESYYHRYYWSGKF